MMPTVLYHLTFLLVVCLFLALPTESSSGSVRSQVSKPILEETNDEHQPESTGLISQVSKPLLRENSNDEYQLEDANHRVSSTWLRYFFFFFFTAIMLLTSRSLLLLSETRRFFFECPGTLGLLYVLAIRTLRGLLVVASKRHLHCTGVSQ